MSNVQDSPGRTTNFANANLATAENEAAAVTPTEISNSYGGPEAGTTSTYAAAYNHPGIVITASAGDDGYYNFDDLGTGSPSPYNQANVPASLWSVVAVGGTSLYLSQEPRPASPSRHGTTTAPR